MMPPHKLAPQANGGVRKEAAKNASNNNKNNGAGGNPGPQQPPMGRNASDGDSQPQMPPGAAGRPPAAAGRGMPFGAGSNGNGDNGPLFGANAAAAAGRGFLPGAHRPYADQLQNLPAAGRVMPGMGEDRLGPGGLAAAAVARGPIPPAAAGATGGGRGPPPNGYDPLQNLPAASRAPAGPPPMGGMRELRVEDALLYLDDVKREFGDRPRVYNEFLAIMKNFKSQEVDTPGVIARVSKLFRGYNNLILGFNKFLPDGYKIRLEDLVQQDQERARQEAASKQQEQLENRQQSFPPRALNASPPNQAQAPPRGPQGKPAAQAARRSSFEAGQGGDQRSSFERAQHSPQQQPKQAPPMRVAGMKASPVTLPPAQQHAPPARAEAPPQAPPQRPAAPAQPPQPQHQAVEFDHAISYVTTIKRRFANDPSTYHAFLEILHTYQKEQRGIKEVLEQVAHLFQDHPDLLKEFTFFLPDAVQEQAKERLHRAAADSEARMAAQARAEMEQAQHESDKGAQDMDVEDTKAHHKFIDMTANNLVVTAPDQPSSSRGRKRAHDDHKEAPVQVALPQQPESYTYNAAVERQFFDAAREALALHTRDGGQAWAEFLKCLDMYAQEILSRSEMLNFVEPLLGKRNTKLFEEFKRILAAAGSTSINSPSMEDSWHSVPLSEIDFSRCRRCSPSYRALPRDYPAPPCSDRNEEENKVLNNVWVSLPVGSEESYTFRHMRRNTYEEILFRCEDERFEIDMVIDSNATTLARLEPIAEEIAQLAQEEMVVSETSPLPKKAGEGTGLGGKKFQLTFDKKILGVIHRNSISRIYGDAGQEMLDLLVKNPAVAIPVVVQRLRQKDKEWRTVRERMNRQWKELAEHNYYKSLDHRSLTWRTTDKRAISTRTLVAEIKDRSANGGKEGHAALQARMDKAKEEHGTFYEVSMIDSLSRHLDLTYLPQPDRRLFTPHLSLMFENNGWVQRDAYRILAFALERGAVTPADKERCHRLWTDLLGPWFNLSLNWMQLPAVAFQENSKPMNSNDITPIVSAPEDSANEEEDDEESLDDDAHIDANVVTEDVRNEPILDDSPSYMDHHPLPAGATVSTLFGEGQVIGCRRSDDTYIIKLLFGTAYLRPSAVLCSILPAEKTAYTSQLRAEDRTKLERPDDMLAIGTQSLYLFFRLHHILVSRLGIAKELAYSVKDDISLKTLVEQMPGDDAAALGRRRYDAYLSLIYSLIDSGTSLHGASAEGGKYEDRVRCLLGHGGYELATMDKLISHILKNLQSMGNDDTMWNLVQLFRRHLDSGNFKPEAFRQEAAYLSDGEIMYAFQQCPVHKNGGDKSVLHMEYLGVIAESEEDGSSTVEPVVEPAAPPVKRPKRDR
jgi:paired amphipathic helix protein Sin3a